MIKLLRPLEPETKNARRSALDQAQSNKCAYCEHKLGGGQSGEIDHYRPRILYPWLIDSWENLLLACSACNGAKGSDFPLREERHRVHASGGDLSTEDPLLLDPFVDDPLQHLAWSGQDPSPKTDRGEATVEICKLNRDSLREERLAAIKRIKTLTDATAALRCSAPEIDERLQRILDETSKIHDRIHRGTFPHAACLRAFLHQLDSDHPDVSPLD